MKAYTLYKIPMTTIAATAARRNFFDLVKGVSNGHKTYRIHHRRGAAILISEEDYEGLIETLELLSLPGFRQSIQRSVRQMKTGKTVSFEKVFGSKA